FHLVRAKLIAGQGTPREAVAHFDEMVREHRYASEAGARYGLASAEARARDFRRAAAEVETIRKLLGPNPMVEQLMARIRLGEGNPAAARDVLRSALSNFPNYRPLHYAYVDVLQG